MLNYRVLALTRNAYHNKVSIAIAFYAHLVLAVIWALCGKITRRPRQKMHMMVEAPRLATQTSLTPMCLLGLQLSRVWQIISLASSQHYRVEEKCLQTLTRTRDRSVPLQMVVMITLFRVRCSVICLHAWIRSRHTGSACHQRCLSMPASRAQSARPS